MSTKNQTRLSLCVVYLLILLFFLLINVKNVTQRSELTIAIDRLTELTREAREFRQKVGKNPHSLNDLVWFSPFKPTNRLLDGWGNLFIIEVAEDGGIKISTNGKDNKRGGEGDGATFLPP